MKKRSILLFTLFLFLFTFLQSYLAIPKQISVIEGRNYSFNIKTPLNTTVTSSPGITTSNNCNLERPFNLTASKQGNYNIKFDLLGLFPVETTVNVLSENFVYPSGQTCGVKILTDGVLIVSVSDVKDENGNIISPAKDSKLMAGDFIKKANGTKIKNSSHFQEVIKENKGEKITLEFIRDEKEYKREITPVKSYSGDYVVGMWVRDSTAGLGTLTFYSSSKEKFAALGHSISDADTGEIMTVREGELVKSKIISINKGERGRTGELVGVFDIDTTTIGEITKNTGFGLFGNVKNKNIIPDIKPVKIGLKNDIKLGKAKIITTLDNNKPEEFEIEIVKINNQTEPDIKGMVIKVTDEKLIERTGGIVQGM